MGFNVHRWTLKVLLFCIVVVITVFNLNNGYNYIKINRYKEFVDQTVGIDELHGFVAQIMNREEADIHINFIDQGMGIFIDPTGSVRKFHIAVNKGRKTYIVDYDYGHIVTVERAEQDLTVHYPFSDLNHFIDLCYKQLNLHNRLKENQYININSMVRLTKDFVYVEEGNFDEVSYKKYLSDDKLIEISSGEIIQKGGLKYVVNIKSKTLETKERVAAIYLYN